MRDVKYLGGDIDPNAIFCTQQNLGSRGENKIVRWDAMELPLSGECVDRIICNPPFGKQLSSPELIPDLYMDCAKEWDRVLRPGGRAVLLVAEQDELRTAVKPFNWKATKEIKVRVLGQSAVLSVWQKPEGFGTMPTGADE